MGALESTFKTSRVSRQNSDSSDDSSSSDDNEEIYYTDDLLIEVLSFVPYKDLSNCRLVCKRWQEIIDGHSVWKAKLDREFKIPVLGLEAIPDHYYRSMYIRCQSEENLLENPCGEGGLKGWEFIEVGGDGFAIENPPGGANNVPDEVGSQSCFATSYFECRKCQVIDLYENEYYKILLTRNLPAKIKVGEWYAARFDCACEYELSILLLDEKKNEIDRFEFLFTEEQWRGKEWHKVSHEFLNVTNVRYVHFEHMGKDRQFWAGHYGIKMTGAFVNLCFKC